MKLTKDNNISKEFAFEGVINLLITGGVGSVTLERSLNDSPFYPLSTDTAGGVAIFECTSGCAYNGSLKEKGHGARYRLNADLESGEVEYMITRSVR